MSLVNFAIRICLKRALLGRTLAKARVFDSMVVPLDETPVDGTLPQIIVATDDDMIVCSSFALDVDARDLDVIIEMELASEVPAPAGGIGFAIPQTDAGLEASLDFIQREIFRALNDPGSVWANLFRRFVQTPKKMLKRRGASNDKGAKFAARQIVITVEPVNEPAYGTPPSGLWETFITAMRADDELAEYGDVVEALIVGEPLPSWRVLQAALGHTDAEARALGSAPFDPDEAGEPPVMTAARLVDVDAQGSEVGSLTIRDGELASFEVPGG